MDQEPGSEGRGQGDGQAHRARVSEGSGQVQSGEVLVVFRGADGSVPLCWGPRVVRAQSG